MTLNEYQQKAMTTCMKSSHNISYMLLNLVGEVGEFSSKVAKSIRKEDIIIKDNDLRWKSQEKKDELDAIPKIDQLMFEEYLELELAKEAGDILWQLSGICSVMDWDLDMVAQVNLDKLASRQTRGVIDGNGDNR